MNRRVRHLIAPLAILASLACGPTSVASPTDVIQTCLSEGSLDGYSDADKRAALNQLAADQDEYSDCRNVIGGSIGSKKVTAGISSNAGSPVAIAKQKRQARRESARRAEKGRQVRRERQRKIREQKLGPPLADPRDAGVFKASSTANGMPLPVLLAVIVLGLLTLTGGLLTLGRRNPRLAGAIRRVKVPGFRR